jgi:predicted DNA-binding transcriptional regulator YafY
MPSNKEAIKRYRIIHRILRRGTRHKSSEITKICNDRGIPVAKRTIQNDLKDLAEDTELGFYLPIVKDTKTQTYYYSEIPKDVFPILELETVEIDAMLFYIKMINQYREYPIFTEISNAVKKVITNSNIPPHITELLNNETLLETETHPFIYGTEFIAGILSAIQERKIIDVEYTKFNSESKKFKIKPLLLKEDKRMWYVVGINTEKGTYITLALDRINNIAITKEHFKPENFNPEEYFKYSFGITVSDEKPVEVIISFDSHQGNYLKTLPIHTTQKIIKETTDKFIVSVQVQPSYEFYSKIKSYGEQAVIISPSHVREHLFNCFKTALNKYNL